MCIRDRFSTLYTDEETVTETSQEFLDAYEEKYGKESADAATALGFDAYLIAIQAIERAGENCTGEDVREALAQTENFQGAVSYTHLDVYKRQVWGSADYH